MALGALPILLIPKGGVDIVLGADERLRHALGRAPLLLSVAFLAGVLEMVPWSLLQMYAKESRWTAQGIALALPLFYGGQILLMYPLGWMADRTARRYVRIGTSAVAIVCMGTMALLTRSSEAWAITFLMGGFATVTYTLGLAILGQQFKSDGLLSVNAAYLASYCVGTILGPPIVGHALDQHGPVALPIALATVNALVLGCACAARVEWQHHRQVPVELSV